jgi:SagB-type dehydrogenase family enzyme
MRVESSGHRVRRSRSLVAFWDGGELVLHSYLTNSQTIVAPLLAQVLGELGDYVPIEGVSDRLGPPPHGRELTERLIAQQVLVVEGTALDEKEALIDGRWKWGHEARYLHYSTQQVRFEVDAEAERERLRLLAQAEPPPIPFKHYCDPGLPLPGSFADRTGGLWDVLLRRRTRRAFERAALSLEDFSTVLLWTWGKTAEVESSVLGRYVLKTSPSGGARHSIEVYPVALRVEGMRPGIYHYSVARHDLEPLREGDFEDLVVRLCGEQGWVRDASAVFFMTAVVERSMWKYRHSHAYRVLHLDAGHLGQTFHLVCTQLGLAPFTTTATQNEAIESELGLDGVSEIALYAAATGVPANPSLGRPLFPG